MTFAVAERKLTHPARKRHLQEPPHKRRSRHSRQEEAERRPWLPDLGVLFKTAAETFARGVLILAFCFGAVHAYLFLTTSSRFAVSQVSFQGVERLSQQSLLESMPQLAGENLFLLDLEKLTTSLTRHPWVKTASIQRKWPNAVFVQIEERQPYARIQLESVYVMDNFGTLVTHDAEEFAHLPLITGMSGAAPELGQQVISEEVLRGLKAMHYLNQLEFFAEDPVTTVEVTGPHLLTFSTRDQGLKVRLGADAVQEGFHNFKIILDALKPTGEGVESIDLSFSNKVVIKPKPGHKGFGNPHKA